MTERDFTTKFNRWLKYNWMSSAVFELKICKEKSIPFNAVQPHQLANLRIAKNGVLPYKIDDSSLGQKPFDIVCMSKVPAYVVIFFYQKRGDNEFVVIDVDHFIDEMETSDRKSITKERAIEIGQIYSLSPSDISS
jgi:penicillin-binding protein-related factor A (putative recombinase)